MSNIVRDYGVDYVELMLRHKTSNAFLPLLLGKQFFAPGALYQRQCRDFSGSDYFLITHAAQSGLAPTGSMSIAAWVNLDSKASDQGLVCKWAGSTNLEYWLAYDTGNDAFEFQAQNSSTSAVADSQSAGSLSTGTWYFLIGGYDADEEQVFIYLYDRTTGLLASDTAALTAPLDPESSALRIGSRESDSAHLDGKMSNVAFWQRTLTANERALLYNSGYGRGYDGIVPQLRNSLKSWWPLDEGSGNAIDVHGDNDLTDTNTVAASVSGLPSPAVYPALAEAPTVIFKAGNWMAQENDTNALLYAGTDLSNFKETLENYLEYYTVFGQQLRVLYCLKPSGAALSAQNTFPSVRQTLEVVSYFHNLETGVFELSCRDKFVEPTDISRRLAESEFDDIDEVPISTWGEIGPYCFGRQRADSDLYSTRFGPIAKCYWVDIHTENPGSNVDKSGAILHLGWTAQALTMGGPAFGDWYLYAESNASLDYNPQKWVRLGYATAQSSRALIGDDSEHDASNYSASYSIKSKQVAVATTMGATAKINCGARFMVQDVNDNLVDSDGPLFISLYHAELEGNQLMLLGSPIHRQQIQLSHANIKTSGSEEEIIVQWGSPVVLAPGLTYALMLTWEAASGVAADHDLNVLRVHSSETYEYYYSIDITRETLLKSAYTGVSLALDSVWMDSSSDFDDGDGDDYSALTLWASSAGDTIPFYDLRIKAMSRWLEDDADGTHTGAAAEIIENPHDIISACLNSPNVFRLETNEVFKQDTDIRGRFDTEETYLQMILDYSVDINELLEQICLHTRLHLIKRRDGRLELNYPLPFNDAADAEVAAEHKLREQLIIKELRDSNEDQLINDLRLYFRRNWLEDRFERVEVRRKGTNQYSSWYYLNKDDSWDDDTARESAMSTSDELYGKRELHKELPFFDYRDPVMRAGRYYADRYAAKEKFITVNVPKRLFHDWFLYQHKTISHSKLVGASKDSSAQDYVKSYNELKFTDESYSGEITGGRKLTAFLDGCPLDNFIAEEVHAEILAIQEQGPYMAVTLSTMGIFERLSA